MSLSTILDFVRRRTQVLGLRAVGAATDTDEVSDVARAGPAHGLVVEGAPGGTPVPVSGTVVVDTSALATSAKQDTAKTVLDNIHAALATAANQALQIALEGTIRQTTTPSRANAATGRIECDAAAVLYIGASLRHVRRITLSSGLATSAASLAEGAPCNALKCDTDDVRIYAQGPESPLIASQSGADWTGAAGWSRVGNVWTHAAAGGVGDLEITPAGASAIAVGETYAVVYTLAWTGGTSLTAKLGTGAGTARSSSATFVELVTSATNGKIIFTPTDDANCSVDVSAVYVIPNLGPQANNAWEPTSAIKIVGVAADATPATPHATAKVWAAWYRRPSAVEVT